MTVVSMTETQMRVLEALATYRYLTTEQMLRIGVSKSKRHTQDVVRGLLTIVDGKREPDLIGELDYGTRTDIGRLHPVCYLTKKGAAALEVARPDLAPVAYLTKAHRFPHDYFHRLNTIDCHIALRLFAEREQHSVRYFTLYKEKIADGPHRRIGKARLQYRGGTIEGDGVAVLDTASGKEALLVIEMANGKEAKRVLDKIAEWCRALADEDVWSVYGVGPETAARIVWIFEDPDLLQRIRARVLNENIVGPWAPYFFLQSYDDVMGGCFGTGWHRLLEGTKTTSLLASRSDG